MGLHVLLCSMVAAQLAYSCLDVGRAHYAPWFDRWVVLAGLPAVTALCALRSAAVREHRAAWIAMAACVGLFARRAPHGARPPLGP